MNHKECRDLFVEALYDELAGSRRSEFDGHLGQCPDCQSAFRELESVSGIMSRRRFVPPTRAEWTAFWNTLESSLKPPEAQSPKESRLDRVLQWLPGRPAWTVSIAAVLLLTVGVYIGQMMIRQPLGLGGGGLETGLSEAERILLNERALNYLERSKVLLLGIVNSDPDESGLGLAKEQQVSRTLVSEAAELKSSLSDADQQRMKQLVGDLEVILLQIANLGEEKGFPAVEIVRSGVERRGILLKINLEQMRPQGTPPAEAKEQQPANSESSI